jgi:hypothetical protein
VAFLANGGRGSVLVENRFVEHSFYRCSVRTQESTNAQPGNPDLSRCNETLALLVGFKTFCQQVAWVCAQDGDGQWRDWLNYAESR